MNGNEAITADHIRKDFGDFKALRDITLTVTTGAIFGFIGKNGAGKTTFMRILCGLMQPTGGTVETRKKIGFLPQNVRFRDAMSGEAMLRFFAGLRGCDPTESLRFAVELELDLARRVDTLSPGQQRKLQLIAATIGSPEVLVLDEPTAGLDPLGVQQVRAVIQALHAKMCTVFLSSHVLMELENLCDAVAVIDKGEILYQGRCGTEYEIETDGLDELALAGLTDSMWERFQANGSHLMAEVERAEIPAILTLLYQRGVQVYGVKRQGMEALYNRLVKEVS